MKARLFALFLVTVMMGPAFAGQLPATDMENLAGDAVRIPAGLQGNPILVILAFGHDQREEAGRVMALLQKAQEANKALNWYELPIVEAPSLAHIFIKNGMREKTNESLHAHIVPQFVNQDEWRKSSHVDSTEPLLAKVDRDGRILKSLPLSAIKTLSDVLRF
jgi:hypothetical protein